MLEAFVVAATGPVQLPVIRVTVTFAGSMVVEGKPEAVTLTLVTPATPVLGDVPAVSPNTPAAAHEAGAVSVANKANSAIAEFLLCLAGIWEAVEKFIFAPRPNVSPKIPASINNQVPGSGTVVVPEVVVA